MVGEWQSSGATHILVDGVDIRRGVCGQALGARLADQRCELLLCDDLAALLGLHGVCNQQAPLDALLGSNEEGSGRVCCGARTLRASRVLGESRVRAQKGMVGYLLEISAYTVRADLDLSRYLHSRLRRYTAQRQR